MSDTFDALGPKIARAVPEAKIAQAVAALTAHLAAPQKSGKQQPLLVENDEYFEIQINTLNPNLKESKPNYISIPNSIYNRPGVTICLLTKDPQDEWEDYLTNNQVTNYTRVVGVKKLASDFKPYENRRLLYKQHDLFVADKAIIPMLPKLLGKNFYNTFTKRPIPAAINSGFKAALRKARDSTIFYLPAGTTMTLRIGHSSQDAKAITANIVAALPQIINLIPRKFDNVTNIQIKTTTSAALPIYLRVADKKDYVLTLEQQHEALKTVVEQKMEKHSALAAKYNLHPEQLKTLMAQAKKAGLAFPKFMRSYTARAANRLAATKAKAAAAPKQAKEEAPAAAVPAKAAKKETKPVEEKKKVEAAPAKKANAPKKTEAAAPAKKAVVEKKVEAAPVAKATAVKRKEAPKPVANDTEKPVTKVTKLRKTAASKA